MPITELAILEIVNPYTATSPLIREFFRKVSFRQAKWSGYPLLFFESTNSPSQVYLISGWTSVEAHGEWIASAENQALPKEGEGLITVIDLMHVEIEFSTMPTKAERAVWSRWEGLHYNPENSTEEDPRKASESPWSAVGRILDEGVTGVIRIRAYSGEYGIEERQTDNQEIEQHVGEGSRMIIT